MQSNAAQIEAMRDDPRLRNSPLAGFLDAFTIPSADDSEGRGDGDDDPRQA